MANFHFLGNIQRGEETFTRPAYINIDSIQYVEQIDPKDPNPHLIVTFANGEDIHIRGEAASGLLEVIRRNAAEFVTE